MRELMKCRARRLKVTRARRSLRPFLSNKLAFSKSGSWIISSIRIFQRLTSTCSRSRLGCPRGRSRGGSPTTAKESTKELWRWQRRKIKTTHLSKISWRPSLKVSSSQVLPNRPGRPMRTQVSSNLLGRVTKSCHSRMNKQCQNIKDWWFKRMKSLTISRISGRNNSMSR